MPTPPKQPKLETLPTMDELKAMLLQRLGMDREPAPFKDALYYSPREVTERLGISQTTLRRWRQVYGFPTVAISPGCIRHLGGQVNCWLLMRAEVARAARRPDAQTPKPHGHDARS